MTIPTLISSTQEKVAIAKLQKVHSTLENAFRMAVSENGTPDTWDLTKDAQGAANVMEKLLPYLRISKNCNFGKGCFPDVTYKAIDDTDYAYWDNTTNEYKIQLADGISVMSNTVDAFELAQFRVDINGFNKPNKLGVDLFYFYMDAKRIYPLGSPNQNGEDYFTNCCINTGGYGCAAWVIYNGNMDYLHCKDLSWNGKKSCK